MNILIYAEADILRNGLRTLLAAITGNSRIDTTDDDTPLEKCLAGANYDLAVLYPGLPFAELLTAIRRAKSVSPQTRLIVVVAEYARVPETLQAGADRVLQIGFSLSQLMSAVRWQPEPQGRDGLLPSHSVPYPPSV